MGVLGPLMDLYTQCHVSGREHFHRLQAPVVLVANHSSHMDTPAILRALPRAWRRRTAVAAATDYFYAKRRLGFSGTHEVMPVGRYWMRREPGRRHPIEIRFGAPIHSDGVEQPSDVMERVRQFFERAGAQTTAAERGPLAGATSP